MSACTVSRLTLQGLNTASVSSRLNALKGAVEEVQAASAVAKTEAQAVARARVENNIRRDDAQQYVNNNAPIQVPNTVTRNDNDFSSTVNHRGDPKAHIDDNGNLIAANPNGTGSATTHVKGSDPANTPWISTTNLDSVDPALGGGSQEVRLATDYDQRQGFAARHQLWCCEPRHQDRDQSAARKRASG